MRCKVKLRQDPDNISDGFKLLKKAIKEILMADQKDLAAAVATLGSAVATLATEMTSAFARLLAKIEAGNPDLAPEVASLTDITAKVTDATNQAKVEGV